MTLLGWKKYEEAMSDEHPLLESCSAKFQYKSKLLVKNPLNIYPEWKYKLFHYNNLKAGQYVKIWKRKTRGQVLACLLTWYWQRNFLREFTEDCFAVFDQSSRVILPMWYCQLCFFLWISCGYRLDGPVEDFWKKL